MKLFAALLFSLLLCTACSPVKESKTETERFTIKSDLEILYVKTVNGNITINAGNIEEAGDDINVTVEKFAYGPSESAAQRIIDQIEITRLDGNTYQIIVDVPKSYRSGAALTFDNVQGKQLILTTTNGNIDVEEFSADRFEMETTNGNLYIKVLGDDEVDGSLVAAKGSIFLDLYKDLSCMVEMSTDIGSINIEDDGEHIKDYDINQKYHDQTAGFSLNDGDGTITAETEVGSINVNILEDRD